MENVTKKFVAAFGPLAPLVVRDHIAAMGATPDNFPEEKLPDLLQALENEISNKILRMEFHDKVSEVVHRV
jgi:hypothetical protein